MARKARRTPAHTKSAPFVGRKVPLQRLREIAAQQESAIVIVYGRRRVGKTALIEHAYGNRNPLKIEGIEGQDEPYQIQSALEQIARFTGDRAHALIRTETPGACQPKSPRRGVSALLLTEVRPRSGREPPGVRFP